MTSKTFVSVLLLCSLTTAAMATTMSIVVKSNPKYCLDLFGQMTQDGTPIDIWECAPGLQGQQWFFDAGSWKIRSAVNSSKCVDAGDMNTTGSKLTLNDCDKTQSLFGWDIATNAIYLSPKKGALTPGSKCMQIASVSKGAVVSIAACSATDKNQQFAAIVGPPPVPSKNVTFLFKYGIGTYTDSSVRHLQVGPPPEKYEYCLSIPDTPAVSNGEEVTMAYCTGSKNRSKGQEWIFTQGSYRIQSAIDPSKCIDATDMKTGTNLMMWDCNGFPQQQWGYKEAKDKATGSVYLTQAPSQSVLCMGLRHTFGIAGQIAAVEDCQSAAVQWRLESARAMQATVIV